MKIFSRTFRPCTALALILVYRSASAQTALEAPAVTSQQVQALLDRLALQGTRLAAQDERIRQLESTVQLLAGTSQATPGAAEKQPVASELIRSAVATPQASAPVPPPEEETHDHMMEIPNGPVLHFRGFFDFDFDKGSVAQQLQYPLGVPGTTTFRAGEFDLFMTSQLSEKLSFLTELVIATDQTNNFEADLERFQLTYRPSRYSKLAAADSTPISAITTPRFTTGRGFPPPREGPLCTTSRTPVVCCPSMRSA